LNAGSDGANWLMYNRTYSGWRFSPLEQINTGNVKKLVPKWIFAGGTLGDQQTTPIVNDGIMFTTSTALGVNRVQAINAATGELLWKRDRRIPEDVGALVRLIPHNRGVALSKDKVIFGTLDAYLVALEAKTGKPVWETKIADYAEGYFVSQAPMVVKGKVIVGISGPGEMGPRGAGTRSPRPGSQGARRGRPTRGRSAAAPSGMPAPTIPPRISCTSAPATPRRGSPTCAAATICTPCRRSRSISIPES